MTNVATQSGAPGIPSTRLPQDAPSSPPKPFTEKSLSVDLAPRDRFMTRSIAQADTRKLLVRDTGWLRAVGACEVAFLKLCAGGAALGALAVGAATSLVVPDAVAVLCAAYGTVMGAATPVTVRDYYGSSSIEKDVGIGDAAFLNDDNDRALLYYGFALKRALDDVTLLDKHADKIGRAIARISEIYTARGEPDKAVQFARHGALLFPDGANREYFQSVAAKHYLALFPDGDHRETAEALASS